MVAFRATQEVTLARILLLVPSVTCIRYLGTGTNQALHQYMSTVCSVGSSLYSFVWNVVKGQHF